MDKKDKIKSAIFRLLKAFIKEGYYQDIEGDLLELHSRREQLDGRVNANKKLLKDVLLLIRPGIIKNRKITKIQLFMISHYILVAFRSFKKYRLNFTINLISLSLAISSCLFISLWIINEYSFDRFH